MSPALARLLRLAGELLAIALAVGATTTASVYALESPFFDHPVRGESARRNFVVVSIVLSSLGIAAVWVLWLAWRRRAALDVQPDGPARLLALAVATLPVSRLDWGTAMTAELSSVAGRAARWRFAAGSVRAALFPPGQSARPASGWTGAAVGILGVLACVATAVYMFVVYPETAEATSTYFIGVLLVVLAVCLGVALAAPRALTTSVLALRAGLVLGLANGAGLLLLSRTGDLEAGAMGFILPAQLLLFVIVPVLVATVSRSLSAAVQSILWGFVFSSVTTFPVYVVESIRRYEGDGGLYLDGDAPIGTSIGTNLTDAVAWLLLVVPGLFIPVGVLGAALVTAGRHAPARARGGRAVA